MFDTYRLGSTTTELVPYEKTVIEYKAPTDASIGLYNEFLEKAQSQLIQRGELTSNEVRTTFCIFRDELQDLRVCKYNMTLNGKGIEGRFEIYPQYYDDEGQFYEQLRLNIIETLSKHIIVTIANHNTTNLR